MPYLLNFFFFGNAQILKSKGSSLNLNKSHSKQGHLKIKHRKESQVAQILSLPANKTTKIRIWEAETKGGFSTQYVSHGEETCRAFFDEAASQSVFLSIHYLGFINASTMCGHGRACTHKLRKCEGKKESLSNLAHGKVNGKRVS